MAILHALGWLFVLMAAGQVLPLGLALGRGETAAAQAFAVGLLIAAFFGGALVFTGRGRGWRLSRNDRIVLFVLGWLLVPLVGTVPYVLSGTAPSISAAFFESASGFTTTGATAVSDLATLPTSLILWRALSQWLGGLATLAMLGLLIGPAWVPTGKNPLGADLRVGIRATDAREGLLPIVQLYGLLTVTCLLALLVAGLPPFDAVCLSLATLATGGFMPRDGDLIQYGSAPALIILSVFMLVGAMSIFFVRNVLEFRRAKWWRDGEAKALLALAAGLAVLLTVIMVRDDTSASGMAQTLVIGIATAASVVSTSGFPVSADAHQYLPFILVFLVAFIGGGRESTAGGLKMFRFLALLRQVYAELSTLLHPHGVQKAIREDRKASHIGFENDMRAIWAHLSILLVAIFVLATVLAAQGLNVPNAMLAAVATISNTGGLYEMVALPTQTTLSSFAGLSEPTRLVLSIAMIIGRMELVMVVCLITLVRRPG